MLIYILLAAVVAILLLKPKNKGLPHSPYFNRLENTLKAEGPGHPCLVLDLDKLDANIASCQSHIAKEKTYRIVAKSLPSLPLIQHIAAKTGTHSIMAFHQPFLNLMVTRLPDFDFLVGKPFPIQVAEKFFKDLPQDLDLQKTLVRIQWLIDSPKRAEQYLTLAQNKGVTLRLNLEIDVGLHRGGIARLEDLDRIMKLIQSNPDALIFSGLMGYEPHIAKAPFANKKKIEELRRESMDKYNQYKTFLKTNFKELYRDDLCFNGAGSPTYQLYKNEPTLNDISVGSSLVKPTDFDLQTIRGKQPALFIATPVIKKLKGTNIPFIEKFTPWIAKWNPNWQESVFVYGGYWKAKAHSPQGLSNNNLYGRSSNQEIFNMSSRTHLNPDDYVFLRPTQSEAVMLEFGDIVVIKDEKIIDYWPVFTKDIIVNKALEGLGSQKAAKKVRKPSPIEV